MSATARGLACLLLALLAACGHRRPDAWNPNAPDGLSVIEVATFTQPRQELLFALRSELQARGYYLVTDPSPYTLVTGERELEPLRRGPCYDPAGPLARCALVGCYLTRVDVGLAVEVEETKAGQRAVVLQRMTLWSDLETPACPPQAETIPLNPNPRAHLSDGGTRAFEGEPTLLEAVRARLLRR
jgi:hypothetical protein